MSKYLEEKLTKQAQAQGYNLSAAEIRALIARNPGKHAKTIWQTYLLEKGIPTTKSIKPQSAVSSSLYEQHVQQAIEHASNRVAATAKKLAQVGLVHGTTPTSSFSKTQPAKSKTEAEQERIREQTRLRVARHRARLKLQQEQQQQELAQADANRRMTEAKRSALLKTTTQQASNIVNAKRTQQKVPENQRVEEFSIFADPTKLVDLKKSGQELLKSIESEAKRSYAQQLEVTALDFDAELDWNEYIAATGDILLIDSSTYEVTSEGVKRADLCKLSGKDECGEAIRLLVVWSLRFEQPVLIIKDSGSTSERFLLKEALDRLNLQDLSCIIVVADRGFHSVENLVTYQALGLNYVQMVNYHNATKAERELINKSRDALAKPDISQSLDGETYVDLACTTLNQLGFTQKLTCNGREFYRYEAVYEDKVRSGDELKVGEIEKHSYYKLIRKNASNTVHKRIEFLGDAPINYLTVKSQIKAVSITKKSVADYRTLQDIYNDPKTKSTPTDEEIETGLFIIENGKYIFNEQAQELVEWSQCWTLATNIRTNLFYDFTNAQHVKFYARLILGLYGLRWNEEQFFKQTKSEVGLTSLNVSTDLSADIKLISSILGATAYRKLKKHANASTKSVHKFLERFGRYFSIRVDHVTGRRFIKTPSDKFLDECNNFGVEQPSMPILNMVTQFGTEAKVLP